jgi:hypothetical protein
LVEEKSPPAFTNQVDMTSEQRVTEFSDSEAQQVFNTAEEFLRNGISSATPDFAIVMGGVGTGKTTVRKQNFAAGYVHFEAGEIAQALRRRFGDNCEKFEPAVSFACDLILREVFEKKLNIVTEMIGEVAEAIKPLVDALAAIGYRVSLNHVDCDVGEAYRRHLRAAQEEPGYTSVAFTQRETLFYLYRQLQVDYAPLQLIRQPS